MKRLLAGLVMLAFLGAALGSALAQRPAPGLDEERMARMTKMMEEMQEQMRQMQEQMRGMQGMGPMQGRMGRMMGEMGQMRGVMQQHRAEMQKLCPGAAAPQPPKKSD